MGLIGLLLAIAIVGVIVWALVTFVPMPPAFKTAIIVVAILIVALYVLSLLFDFGPVHDVPIPKVTTP